VQKKKRGGREGKNNLTALLRKEKENKTDSSTLHLKYTGYDQEHGFWSHIHIDSNKFTHLCSKYLLSIYHVVGTFLFLKKTASNKIMSLVSTLNELTLW
jgi:hypothetical protein